MLACYAPSPVAFLFCFRHATNSTAAASHGQCLPKTSSRCLAPSSTATHDFEVTSYPLLQGIGVEKLVSSTVFSVGGFNWTISFFPDGVRHCCLPKTSSRCLAPSSTATHDFEVTSYPLLQGIGVEKLVSSTVFSVGGFNWTISFFPDGVRHCSFGNASAFLNCLSPEKDVRARFTLNLLDKSGAQVTKFEEMEYTFTPKCVYQGYAQFAGKSWLKSWSDNNGNFIIRCVLTVIGESRTEVKRDRVLVTRPNLQDHLEDMRKKGEGADVTFSVCGQLFHAHRCLLAARSPVFKAELFGSMTEKAAQSIKVEDIEPPILEALLHFVYTDSMPDDEHSKDGSTAKLQHLLVAADRYGLDGLMVHCESKLCEGIDVETVATTLVLAEQHHCKDLQEACVEFMAPQNVLQAVMATDGFKHLVASRPLLMKDILDKVSSTD